MTPVENPREITDEEKQIAQGIAKDLTEDLERAIQVVKLLNEKEWSVIDVKDESWEVANKVRTKIRSLALEQMGNITIYTKILPNLPKGGSDRSKKDNYFIVFSTHRLSKKFYPREFINSFLQSP